MGQSGSPFRTSAAQFAGPSLTLRSLGRPPDDRTAADVPRARRRGRTRLLVLVGAFVPLIFIPLSIRFEWPEEALLAILVLAAVLPALVLQQRFNAWVRWLEKPGPVDDRTLAPPLGLEPRIEWTCAGARHVLEPAGLSVDGRLVAAASDGYDSIVLELQQHDTTGDQLWLIAASLRPRVHLLWQGALPPGEAGMEVAAMLLHDSRVRDETRARTLADRKAAMTADRVGRAAGRGPRDDMVD